MSIPESIVVPEPAASAITRPVRIIAALGAAAGVVVLLKLVGLTAGFKLQTATVALFALLALEHTRRNSWVGAAAWGVMVACTALAAKWLAAFFIDNWNQPHTWDFLAFFVDGSVGARRLNFYDPHSYQQVFATLRIPIAPEPGFVEEVVDVGFKYPPVTMLLLAPLGLMSFQSAHLAWLCFVGLTTVGAALVLAWLLPRETAVPARILCAATLVFALPATLSNAFFEQTNCLLLILAAVCCLTAAKSRSGLWAALAMCVKPLMAVTGVFLLLTRRWRAVLLAGIVLAIAGTVTLLVFGPRTTFDYLFANPIANVPPWQYTGWINQSLLATLLRTLDATASIRGSELVYPPFLFAAAFIAAVSGYFAWRSAAQEPHLSLGILLAAGLLLYPGTLVPYSTLLLIPLAYFCARRDTVPGGRWATPVFVALVYLALAHVAFIANLAVWIAACAWSAAYSSGSRIQARVGA